jgi:hypothetical protein
MQYRIAWIPGAGLAGLLFAAGWTSQGRPLQAQVDEEPGYETSCDANTPGMFLGYVRSKGADAYQVDGLVKFSFSNDPLYRRTITAMGHGFVSARQRVLVSQTPAPFVLAPGDYCLFDVSGAIRKLP